MYGQDGQNRRNRFAINRFLRSFSGTKGIKRAAGIFISGLFVVLSLPAIVYILVTSSLFNPTLIMDSEATGTLFAFFSLLILAGIACYMLYLFLGKAGFYNTRFFRGIPAVLCMLKDSCLGFLRKLPHFPGRLFRGNRKTGKSTGSWNSEGAFGSNAFSETAILYNDNSINGHYTAPAANVRLLFSVSAMVIASRLLVYFIGYIVYVYFNKVDLGFFKLFESIWVRWDSNHYIFLAEKWYTNLGDDKLLIVFFPLYSLMVKFFNLFIPNTVVSGIIVSNSCLVAACFYLVKLVEIDYGRETGYRVVKYVLIYPFSFFLGIVYTESLFLMLLVMFFYYLRKKDWLLAGIIGFLASLTRLYGVLLLVPAGCEVLLSREFKAFFRPGGWRKSWKNFLKIFLCLLLIPAGIGFYLYINMDITGSWFRFLEYQKTNWYNGFGFIGTTLKGIASAAIAPWENSDSKICIWWPAILSFVLALFTMIYGIRKIRISYLLFMLVYTYIAFSPTWLISGERYMLVLFPMYIPLALLGRKKWADTAITVVSAAFSCYCIFLFIIIGVVY